MDSSGKKVGAPLLALLLVAVVGVAMRYVPEDTAGTLPLVTVRSSPVASIPAVPVTPRDLNPGFSLLERVAEFGVETLLPPTEFGSRDQQPAKTPTSPLFVQERQTPTRVLSDYEIFAILHPPYYLKYLSTIEDLMIGDGRLGPSEKQVFDSEAKVIAFWRDKVFDYIVLKGIMAPEDRARFEYGLEVVQELHREEANYLRYDVQSSKYQVVAFWESFVGLFLPRAQAQSECAQAGAGSPQAGQNLTAPCCNCTVNGVPIGCLNAVCSGRPAIWDQATGICGCG